MQVDSTPRQGPEADFEARLLECLRSVGTSVDASGLGISPDDGVRLLQEVLAKHPEIFWSNGGCTYTYDSSGLLTFSPKYLYGAGEIPSMRDAYEGRVAQALDWLSGLGISDDADKAKALHDYLVQHAEYSRTQLSGGEVPMVEHTAYGIMANGTGVCDGYARAYQDLLARSGIPSVVIQSEAMNHAWNLVSVGGTWRHVDVTFDDPVIRDPAGTIVPDDEVRATYFLKSDAYMQAHGHYGWTSDVQATDASLDAKDDWRVFRA